MEKSKPSNGSRSAADRGAKDRVGRVDPYGFERSEDFDYESYEELMSEYLVVLTRRSIKWSKLLKGKSKVQKNMKLKRYVRKGIPNEHRALIWMAASGAQDQLERNPGHYQSLLGAEHDPKLVETIKTDLNRTFPENIYFRKTSNPCMQKALYNVLLAYGHHNPAVGYCQGMNFIAGYLLIVTKDEEKSFWLMEALLSRILPDCSADLGLLVLRGLENPVPRSSDSDPSQPGSDSTVPVTAGRLPELQADHTRTICRGVPHIHAENLH